MAVMDALRRIPLVRWVLVAVRMDRVPASEAPLPTLKDAVVVLADCLRDPIAELRIERRAIGGTVAGAAIERYVAAHRRFPLAPWARRPGASPCSGVFASRLRDRRRH